MSQADLLISDVEDAFLRSDGNLLIHPVDLAHSGIVPCWYHSFPASESISSLNRGSVPELLIDWRESFYAREWEDPQLHRRLESESLLLVSVLIDPGLLSLQSPNLRGLK